MSGSRFEFRDACCRCNGLIAMVLGLSGALGAPVLAQSSNTARSFTTFGVPGAGQESGQGTMPIALNEAGMIVGTYTDVSTTLGTPEGFVRAANGAITTFFAPAGGDTINIVPQAIKKAGTIRFLHTCFNSTDRPTAITE